mgnify:CR=1 FL=1
MTNLGYCYEVGIGVEENPQKAVEIYRRAADLDYDVAQCNLGYCYEAGIGVEKIFIRLRNIMKSIGSNNYVRFVI